jgi:cysteinyl-tRNA synthetase
MPLVLYNTFSKKEEIFVPKEKNVVRMYTCGPTVYGRPHIGNYSSFLLADLLRRWFEVNGYEVIHAKNITDVGHLLHDAESGDDKIEAEAKRTKKHPLEIAEEYTKMYFEDELALGFLEPKYRPRATEYVPHMKVMIEGLLQKGIAYETDDGIYYSVEKFPAYGKLSGNTLEGISSGARVHVNEKKKHPADFALWKFCVGENAHHVLRWASPGKNLVEGFPGWHIECSAMSGELLGNEIDVHTGGEDNIFPHHECEIAQTEAFYEHHPFVRAWVHRRRIDLAVTAENGKIEKMSKSLGNVLSVPDIVNEGYEPLDLRFLLLSIHYRTRLKFSWKGMEDAKKARRKIMEWMKELETFLVNDDGVSAADVSVWSEKFSEAMNADLNTPAALAVVFDLLSWSRNQKAFSVPGMESLKAFREQVRHTFGCFDATTEDVVPNAVGELLKQREAARKNKDFAESDRLRDAILALGYEVKDTSEGQKTRKL